MATFDIPEDIVCNHVLPHLPVISLLRFKSVCKLWYAIIKSSTFITRHLHHSTNDTIVTKHDYSDKQEFLLLSGDKYQVSVNMDIEQHWYEATIVGCCNGIICLHNTYSGEIALWNPALKQLKSLPTSPTQYLIDSCTRSRDFCAFGFDIKSNDYKVIRILPQKESNCLVNIYNLSSGSWRNIPNDCLFPPVIYGFGSVKPVLKNGRCFWLARSVQNEPYWSLVWFDLSKEVFGAIPLPGEVQSNCLIHAVDLFGGKIACIMSDAYTEQSSVWVLEDELMRGSQSWTKQYIIEHYALFLPRGFVENGEFLLAVNCDHQGNCILSLYNFASKVKTPLPVTLAKNITESLFVLYRESLVSIR